MIRNSLRRVGVLAMAGLYMVWVAVAAIAAGDRCEPVMREMIKTLQIASEDVRSFEVSIQSGSYGSGPIHVGWVRFGSCKGFLVVETTDACDRLQSYTLGDCAVKGAGRY